ncbi:MAG: glycosyltransferase [Acidobacteriota bacterium]
MSASSSSPRLVIVDPTLVDFQGHHAEYGLAVSEAAVREGFQPILLSHERCELGGLPDGVELRPTFSGTQYELSPGRWRRELGQALATLRLDSHDHLFVHTIAPRELDQLVALALSGELEPVPHCHVLFRRDFTEYRSDERALLEDFFRQGDDDARLRRFHFHVDTEPLARQHDALTSLSHRRFTVLPIPHRHREVPLRRPRAHEPLTITYLGDARTEKGYLHLPAAIETLLTDPPGGRPLSVLVQSNPNLPGGEPGILAARQRLARLRPQGVRLLEGPLAPADYRDLLAASDIVVLPYDAERYRRRSSGVLVEALSAGKVPVVPAGTWLAQEAGPEQAVSYRRPDELGAALRRAVADHAALAANAEAAVPAILARHCPDRLVKKLKTAATTTLQTSDASRPRVLWISPLDPLAREGRTGAGRVVTAQLRHLVDQGHDVLALLVDHEDFRRRRPEREPRETVALRFLAEQGVRRAWVSRLPPSCDFEGTEQALDYLRVRADVAAEEASFAHELRLRRLHRIPASLAKVVAEEEIDLALVNYAWNAELLDQLGLSELPTACEIHDLQSTQHALRRREAVDVDERAEEVGYLRRFDGLLSISTSEKEELERELPDIPIVDLVPPLDEGRPALAELAGVRHLRDLTNACGELSEAPAAIGPRLERETRLDLLIVSSLHLPNVRSLRWFLDEVYRPVLKPAGVNVLVAGNINRAKGLEIENDERCYLVGELDDLGPLHAAARMTVLPITEGAGTAIKTLEAFARRQPLLGTPLAFRGLSGFGLDLSPFQEADARAFGERLLATLESRESRLACAERVGEAAGMLGDRRRHDERMHELLSPLLPEAKRRELTPRAPAPSTPMRLVELSEPLARFNAVLRGVVEGRTPSSQEVTRVSDDLTDPSLRSQAKELFRAWWLDRDAPLLDRLGSTVQSTWRGQGFDDLLTTLGIEQKPVVALAQASS